MLLISESFAITIFSIVNFTQLSSLLLLPSVLYRLYSHLDITSPNVLIVLITSILCITGSCFQEAMIRSLKKRFGYISSALFLLSVPLTYYNILFSDPAPYFTICTYGCFSIEPCYTNDQNWGNMISLSFIFALVFLLSAEVLALKFNFRFLKLSAEELERLILEVKEKYKNHLRSQGHQPGVREDAEEDHNNVTSEKVLEIHSEGGDMFSNKDPKETYAANVKFNTEKDTWGHRNVKEFRLQNEFVDVKVTQKPINYSNK